MNKDRKRNPANTKERQIASAYKRIDSLRLRSIKNRKELIETSHFIYDLSSRIRALKGGALCERKEGSIFHGRNRN